jgi:hypothetical protein
MGRLKVELGLLVKRFDALAWCAHEERASGCLRRMRVSSLFSTTEGGGPASLTPRCKGCGARVV